MPIHYRIDVGARTVFVTIEGVVAGDEPESCYRRVNADPSYEPGLDFLVDARRVERIDVYEADARNLAALAASARPLPPAGKVAIATAHDAMYGMARMYQSLREGGPYEVRAYRDMTEARDWLGLPPESA